MSQNTPFKAVRSFLQSLPSETRDDAFVHVLMKHLGTSALMELASKDRAIMYDDHFSDHAVGEIRYLGTMLSLRSYLDYYVWGMTDAYNIERQQKFFSFAREHISNSKEDAPENAAEQLASMNRSWQARHHDLVKAAPIWDEIKSGPLSNAALDAYTSALMREKMNP